MGYESHLVEAAIPAASTNIQNPTPYRLGFFLSEAPVLVRFPAFASCARASGSCDSKRAFRRFFSFFSVAS